jgi:hypothetical protein
MLVSCFKITQIYRFLTSFGRTNVVMKRGEKVGGTAAHFFSITCRWIVIPKEWATEESVTI